MCRARWFFLAVGVSMLGACAPQPEVPKKCIPRPHDDRRIAAAEDEANLSGGGDPRQTESTTQKSQQPGGGLPGPSDEAERRFWKGKTQYKEEVRRTPKQFDLPYCAY